MSIQLRNPHSVEGVLRTRPKDVIRVNIAGKAVHASWERVENLCKELKVPLSFGSSGGGGGDKSEMGRQGGSHAQVRERQGTSLEELFSNAPKKRGGKGLWLALDQIQDPHNLGAIFRAAAFFGVQGMILTSDRSAPMSNVVYDVASGGIEYVPFVMQPNLKQALEFAKDAGVWILGTSEHANDELKSVGQDRPWLLVMGNEETGLRRLTEESCDVLCKIPGRGKVGSLNVAVAAGIMISHLSG